MALKGKKKSRARGSQARRRPAAAPRPSYGAVAKPRWYQTTTGLVAAFVALMLLGILVWWYVADNRAEAEELATAQNELQTYTQSIEGVIGSVSPVANELSTAGELNDAQLEKKVNDWKDRLASAQTLVGQTTPPSGLEPLNNLFTQALLLYVQSAEQYALVPDLEGEARDNVAGKAAGSFQAASGIVASAIELLDNERQETEMTSSGLTTPGGPPEAMTPETQVEIPAGGEDAEQGNE